MKDDLTIPRDIDIERAIFYAILNEPEEFIRISDKLEPKDFYDLAHQDLCKAMLNLCKAGQEIDIVSVKAELKNSEIDPKPAIQALAAAYDSASFIGNVDHFIKEIKNKSVLREIIYFTTQHAQKARLNNAQAEKLLGSLEQRVVDVSDSVKGDKPVNPDGILNELQEQLRLDKEHGWRGYSTGIDPLDERTGGFLPTHCWIIGAYTGTGKTFLALQFILTILKQKGKVLLISTEMDRKMNMVRFLANISGVGSMQILKGMSDLEDHKRQDVKKAGELLRGYGSSLTIYDDVRSVEAIRLKAKKMKLQTGLNVIVVDFIQNLEGEGTSLYEQMSKIAVNLQKLGQELGVTMIMTSQVSQAAAGWSKKEAIEYKGAGEIAAIADVGLWIRKHKDQKSIDYRTVSTRKVRHGFPITFDIKFDWPSGSIEYISNGESKKEKKEVGDGKVTDQLF